MHLLYCFLYYFEEYVVLIYSFCVKVVTPSVFYKTQYCWILQANIQTLRPMAVVHLKRFKYTV